MLKNALISLMDYHYALYEIVWTCVEEMSEEQFTRENDYSLRSVRNHLVHVINVDERWLARMQYQTLPDSLDYADYPRQESLRPKWAAVRRDVEAYARELTDEELAEIVKLDFPRRGGARHSSRWQILLHMVNHGTDHRAQILALLHALGGRTFEQDAILHWWALDED